MADVVLKNVQKSFGRIEGHPRRRSRHSRRRVRRLRRPLRLRKVDPAAADRRARGHHRGRSLHRRRAGERPRAGQARHRHGVPVLRALSAYERLRQHRLRPGAGEVLARREIDAKVREAARMLQIEQLLDRKPRAALRRPAPARRHRPRHRARPEGVPLRRAALESRRGAARADARRDRQAPHRHAARP